MLSSSNCVQNPGQREGEQEHNYADGHSVTIRGIRISFFIHIAEEHLGGSVGTAARHRHYEQETHVDRTDDKKRESGSDVRPD
ncbi:hypothetical protein D3C73_1432950 [compost metagenome]